MLMRKATVVVASDRAQFCPNAEAATKNFPSHCSAKQLPTEKKKTFDAASERHA
jgi:hypothetical protein